MEYQNRIISVLEREKEMAPHNFSSPPLLLGIPVGSQGQNSEDTEVSLRQPARVKTVGKKVGLERRNICLQVYREKCNPLRGQKVQDTAMIRGHFCNPRRAVNT